MSLNPKQEKFCLEYASNGNATEAYAKAFGTDNLQAAAVQASRLLRKNNVAARLKEISDEMSSKAIMSAEEIQKRLTAIGRGEVTEEIILKDGSRVQKKVAVRDVLRALELLCRVKGMFVTKVEGNFNGVPIVISGGDKLED